MSLYSFKINFEKYPTCGISVFTQCMYNQINWISASYATIARRCVCVCVRGGGGGVCNYASLFFPFWRRTPRALSELCLLPPGGGGRGHNLSWVHSPLPPLLYNSGPALGKFSKNLYKINFAQYMLGTGTVHVCSTNDVDAGMYTLMLSWIAKNSIRFDSDSLVTFLPEVRFDSDSELFWFEEKKVGICPCN